MKILFLSRWFPYPPDNGSKIRIYNLLRQLAKVHTVDLISFCEQPPQPEHLAALSDTCGKIATTVYRPFQPRRRDALAGFFSALPRSLVDTHSAELEQQVRGAVTAGRYDAVIASQIDMIPYAARLNVPARIFEEIELTTLYEQFAGEKSPVKRARNALTWYKLSRYLNTALPRFHGATVVSEQERERVRQVIPAYPHVSVVPNGVDLEFLSGDFGQPEENTLIYNGALTYSANFDAMAYFLGSVFPLIREECPAVRLYITGKTSGVPVEQLPNLDGVVFTGYLMDVRPRVACAWTSIVPLRVGGGTRLKVLESMALGTPVVSTSKGAEGLNLRPGQDLLIADTPVGFASAVLRLLSNAVMRREMAAAARRTVEAAYSWNTIGQQFNGFLESVASRQE